MSLIGWVCVSLVLHAAMAGDVERRGVLPELPGLPLRVVPAIPRTVGVSTSEEAESLRMDITEIWEQVLSCRRQSIHADTYDFIKRRYGESRVDHVSPLRLAMDGCAGPVVVMGLLADPEGVEIKRCVAYMTDDEDLLRNLLKIARSLHDLMSPLRSVPSGTSETSS